VPRMAMLFGSSETEAVLPGTPFGPVGPGGADRPLDAATFDDG
jgi:hypothetical protein